MLKTFRFTQSLFLIAFAAVSFISFGCNRDKDDPENPDPDNEVEVITTLTLTLTDAANTSNVVVATFKDPDGDGGGAPTQFDNIELDENTTYNVSITLLNESDPSDVENISDEVLEEADEHLFCFAVTDANTSITKTDVDSNNLPVGLESVWETGAASTGMVKVWLKHQPDVKDGSCSPGDTDIEVEFDLVVQ